MSGNFLRHSAIRAGLLLATMLFSNGVAAQDPGLITERPNPPGEPTEVTVGIYVFDIDEIDDVSQRFSIDMFTIVSWQDARLALPEDQRLGQMRTMPFDQIWSPQGLVVNDRGLSPQLPRIATVDDLGNVSSRQRLYGELAVPLQLSEFPFDTQRLPIDFMSYKYSPDEVLIRVNTELQSDASSFSAAGWDMKIVEPEHREFTIPSVDVVRTRVTYYIEAKRKAQYYIFTMFVPMTLIVFMSWTVFWLQPEIVPARIGISTASIFSLLALGFSIRLGLPAVSYTTRADLFVIGCTLMIFVALGVAVIGSRWASSDKLDRALRLNAAARLIYVGLFILVAAVTFLT